MKVLKVACAVVVALSMAGFAFSGEIRREARIAILEGDAEVQRLDKKEWIPARVGMVLTEGDTLRTKEDSWVFLNLDGDGETAGVEVDENSRLMISEFTKDVDKKTQRTLLDLAIGKVLIKAKKIHSAESKFQVKTPTSVVGVRGTKFSVEVEALED